MTGILRRWSAGDEGAADELLPLVYDELKRLAAGYLKRERPGHTLQPTALVHEAYLRLAGRVPLPWNDRVHFFAVVARAMRRILVDHARERAAAKRGGGGVRVALDEARDGEADAPEGAPNLLDLLELDRALDRLAGLDRRKAQVIELRFFGGLTIDETAGALGVSAQTIGNETRKARAWLYRELCGGAAPDGALAAPGDGR